LKLLFKRMAHTSPGRSSETKYGRHSRDVGGRDLKVYLSQGVVIADKHLEIIIRQMTSKVAITTPGRSGLFGRVRRCRRGGKINRSLARREGRLSTSSLWHHPNRPRLRKLSVGCEFSGDDSRLNSIYGVWKIDYLRGLKSMSSWRFHPSRDGP
jgi:hypothetical protein